MERCTVCLSTGPNMTPMDETVVNNYNLLTNLDIQLSDHIPLFTCDYCCNALTFCAQFRNKCIESHHILSSNDIEDKEESETVEDTNSDYYVLIKKEKGESNSEYVDDLAEEAYNEIYKMDEELLEADQISEIAIEYDDDGATAVSERTLEDNASVVAVDTDTSDWRMSPQTVTQEIEVPAVKVHCGLCPEIFESKEILLEHLTFHKSSTNCSLCLEQCNSMSQLLAHRTTHLPDDEKGCLMCERAFLSVTSLEFHYMSIHKLSKRDYEDLKREYFDNNPTTINGTEIITTGETLFKKPRITRKYTKRSFKKTVNAEKVLLTKAEVKKLLEKQKTGFMPYYCGVCPQELEEKNCLLKHLDYHQTDVCCSLCEINFTNFTHLLAHRFVHIPDIQNGCLYCDEKFENETDLEIHYMIMHNFNNKELPFFCEKCSRSYETDKQFEIHKKYCYSTDYYICDYCNKGFKLKCSLVSHIIKHVGTRKYKCDLCDYSSKRVHGLKEHKIRRHLSSRVYCKLCRRTFLDESRLLRHLPCAPDADRTCPVCGITLKPSSSFKNHMLTHTDIYTYECALCGAKYKSRTAFETHVDRHNNFKKFACEYCDMRFYSQPVLIKHRRIHTGEKPYVCKVCGRAFTGNNNLKVHMKVHGFHLIKKKSHIST